MSTINETAPQWRPNTQLALAPTKKPGNDIPKVGDADESDGFKLFGEDGFTFQDFIDVINPLQHIPIIGTLYREMTEDTLDPGSRVIGGTLFLGPFGTVSALANVMVDEATGRDMGEHVLALFEDPEAGGPEVSDTNRFPIAVAATATPSTAPATGFSADQAIDPVTAWAQAEASYRQKTPAKTSNLNSSTGNQQAAVSLSETTSVADWARAEVSYRKAASEAISTQASTATPIVAQAPQRQPARGIDALAALRNDLQAGGQRNEAQAASVVRSTRQQTASLAAARYARQQPAPMKKGAPQQVQPTVRSAPGAIAKHGGWFSETMLSALGKIDNKGDSAKQAGPTIHPTMVGAIRPTSIDLSR
ncbi:MAG: hypothetical protein HN377_01375 [Alphaproteobacteria bacterium]|nr:hypothetical protein [Alphaproteobacteria bacterium]